MNINPAAAASVAGTSRAAARGGEADGQATESTRQQSKVDRPAGATTGDSALNAGDQTGDRGGDGRQVYDTFERIEKETPDEDQENESNESRKSANTDGVGGELDLEA